MTFLDSSSLKFWEFVSEFGFVMVIVGVVGEGAELIVKWVERRRGKAIPKKETRWLLPVETLFFMILVIGLAMEFLGSHQAIRIADAENSRLNAEAGLARKDAGEAVKQASRSNERSKQLESTNIVLNKQLLELRIKLQKQIRQITPTDNDDFIAFLKNCPNKKPVKVFVEKAVFESDFETRNYARQIRVMLDDAGYGGKDNDIIKLENFSLLMPIAYTNRESPFFIVAFGQEGKIDWPGLKITVDKNAMIVAESSPDFSCLAVINRAFGRIEIVPDITIRNDWRFIKTNGDWGILIPARF